MEYIWVWCSMKRLVESSWLYFILGFILLIADNIFIPDDHHWNNDYPIVVLIISYATLILSLPLFYISFKMDCKKKGSKWILPSSLGNKILYIFLFLCFGVLLNFILAFLFK